MLHEEPHRRDSGARPSGAHNRNLYLTWLAVLGAWEAAYRVARWESAKFPSPLQVLDALVALLGPSTNYALLRAVGVSAARFAIGFALSVALGGCFGVLMWRRDLANRLTGGVFLGLQSVPSVCWVPLAVLCLGSNEASTVFVVVMGSFFSIALSFRDGLRAVPPRYLHAAGMLGAKRWTLFRSIALPAALPALASTLRQGFSFAWRSLMSAEVLLALTNSGVGSVLQKSRQGADVAQVIGTMLVMVCIGAAVDGVLFAPLEARVRSRFQLAAAPRASRQLVSVRPQ